MTSYDIGISGFGAMGKWFAYLLTEDGNHVSVYDTDPERRREAEALGYRIFRDNRKLAEENDLTMISVLPIRNSLVVIEEIGPVLRPDQGVFDITSLKERQLEAMQRYVRKGEYFGTHPVYAEGLFKDQVTAFVKGNGETWYERFKDFCRQGGSIVHETTAERHDDMMAIIQGLLHCAEYTTAHAFRKSLGTHERALEARGLASPVYRASLDFAFRILDRNPELYWDIAYENRHRVIPYVREFSHTVLEYLRQLEEGDEGAFLAEVRATRDVFQEIIREGSEESTLIIRSLPRRNSHS